MNQNIEIQRLVATNGTNRCVSKFAQAIHIHVYGRTFFDNFVYIVDSWLLACCQPHGLEAVVLWVSHTAILGTVAEWPAGQLDIYIYIYIYIAGGCTPCTPAAQGQGPISGFG